MSAVHVVARHSIKPGKLDDFKRIGKLAFALARDKEPNTKQYEWFFSADQSMCVVLHRYADFASFQEHFANLTQLRQELLNVCDLSAEIYGDLPPDALAKLGASGAEVFAPFQGFMR